MWDVTLWEPAALTHGHVGAMPRRQSVDAEENSRLAGRRRETRAGAPSGEVRACWRGVFGRVWLRELCRRNSVPQQSWRVPARRRRRLTRAELPTSRCLSNHPSPRHHRRTPGAPHRNCARPLATASVQLRIAPSALYRARDSGKTCLVGSFHRAPAVANSRAAALSDEEASASSGDEQVAPENEKASNGKARPVDDDEDDEDDEEAEDEDE